MDCCSSGALQLRFQASYWRQLAVLSRRLGKAMWVDPMLLAMNWGAALLMALGLGIVYWQATRDTGHLSSSLQPLRLGDFMACVSAGACVWYNVCMHVWRKVCAHV